MSHGAKKKETYQNTHEMNGQRIGQSISYIQILLLKKFRNKRNCTLILISELFCLEYLIANNLHQFKTASHNNV